MIRRELVRDALDSLLAHRLRATLSAIGIVTGVATVVTALAIAAGARRQAVADIGQLGVDNIIVRAVPPSGGRAAAARLTKDAARALTSRLPRATVATVKVVASTARGRDRTAEVTVLGVTPSWEYTAGLRVGAGRWFDSADSRTRPAVIGWQLATLLFQEADPIGQLVEAAGEWRRVVGVVADATAPSVKASSSAVQAFDASRAVFVPLESLDVSLHEGDTGDAVSQIVVRVSPGDDVSRGADTVRMSLAERHGRDAGMFDVVVPQELLNARLRTQRRFDLLLLSTGALALFVSGMGIMNIMVASVSERAVEIGIRRAFGARRLTILLQFGTEATLLSTAAGLVGIPVGIGGAAVAAWAAAWPVAVTMVSVVIALALAIGVGVAAAIYPARLAATMPPAAALRA